MWGGSRVVLRSQIMLTCIVCDVAFGAEETEVHRRRVVAASMEKQRGRECRLLGRWS